jgi:Flp pilus assembly protein TadD
MIAANRSAPADPEPHIGLGAAYCALKKVEASAKEFVVAQLLDTKTQRPRFARAHCLESLNDWPSARAVLKESVALAPDDPEVLNNMGFSLADHDEELDAALAMVQRASNADPSNAFYLDSLSWVQFKLGHYAEALEASKAALSRLPVNPEVMEHFADIAERNGRPDVAKGAWITAKKFSNDDVQKARLTVKIDRLAGVTAFQPEE